MGKRSRQRNTGLDLEGRITRSAAKKAREQKLRDAEMKRLLNAPISEIVGPPKVVPQLIRFSPLGVDPLLRVALAYSQFALKKKRAEKK